MKDGFPKELIQHIVEGIQMYAKHNGYTKLDKVILYKLEPGVMTVLLAVNGYEHELDLDGFDDETDEERQLRRGWQCENDSIYEEYWDELEKSFSCDGIQVICDEISKLINVSQVTYEEE